MMVFQKFEGWEISELCARWNVSRKQIYQLRQLLIRGDSSTFPVYLDRQVTRGYIPAEIANAINDYLDNYDIKKLELVITNVIQTMDFFLILPFVQYYHKFLNILQEEISNDITSFEIFVHRDQRKIILRSHSLKASRNTNFRKIQQCVESFFDHEILKALPHIRDDFFKCKSRDKPYTRIELSE